MAELRFLSWVRENVAGLASGVVDGRPRARMSVTLSGADAAGAPTTSQTRDIDFLLAGPADVERLQRRAVVKRYPTPGTLDHESNRCPHVELSDPALPWRYSPTPKPASDTGSMHPWVVLVVGTPEEIGLGGGRAMLSQAVQDDHRIGPAGTGYRWAHVQEEDGRRIARLLSGRPLLPGTDYVAALVPAYDEDGQPRWTGSGPVTVPVYDHWRFRTATPAGSFEDLAARLEPGAAPPSTGRAPVDYPRLPAADDLEVRGALAPIGAVDAALDPAVRADLDGLRTPATDPQGRPIVGLPRYGDAWDTTAPDTTPWGATLNTDARDRGVGGLGLELGIRLQDELADEAAANLGALAEARQRVSGLVLGLAASRRLWRSRMPSDPMHRLWLLGPALRRVVTPTGSVADLATAPGRALPAGIFSTAARRMLRPGPARTSLLDGAVTPADILQGINFCPSPPEPGTDGIVLGGIDPRELEQARRQALETGQVSLETVVEQAAELAQRVERPELTDLAFAIVHRLEEAMASGTPAPWLVALELLARAAAEKLAPEEARRLAVEMREFLERFPEPATEEDLPEMLGEVEEPEPVEPPCIPVDLDGLADGVSSAFDPTGPDAPAIVRVLDTIDGWDPAQPLAPPEVCIGLDRPMWADVEDAFPEWLLPGVGAVPEDSVIAVETNPRFVDDLLVGLNTQLLAELRWRNIPVATGCTPLRVFWDRAETTAGARVDDIIGVHAWDPTSDVGEPQHRPAGASGRDLVVLVRGNLFLRYPATMVYLRSAAHGAAADFDQDPDPALPRILPSFQGRIASDIQFFGFQGFDPDGVVTHWLVFEEPPAGYRWDNDPAFALTQGHTWAAQAIAPPVRVLIRGDALDPEG